MYSVDLDKLNSLTKYPSILTFHELADNKRHGLKNEVIASFHPNEEVYLYEKIDGENSRIILISNGENVDYFIGSRNELLHAKGDRIAIPTGNIARYFKPIAETLEEKVKGTEGVTVVYFESYGGLTPKTKQYSHDRTQFGRVFDVFHLSTEEFHLLMEKEKDAIASWRDAGGQPYMNEEAKETFIREMNLPSAPLLAKVKGQDIPPDMMKTLEWMDPYRSTNSGINEQGISEGVIARTFDRKKIAKLRFEDYEKTRRYH